MLRQLFLTVALWFVALNAAAAEDDIGDYENADLLRQHLGFVERNVLTLLRLGTYPQLYNSSYPRIQECGCYFSPTKIIHGSKVGLQCTRKFPDENPPYNEENCGRICNDPHNNDVVLFCPHGWDSDCARGCFPPDKFESVEARIDFWELTLTSLMMYGSDYIAVAQDYLTKCGCDGKIRPIRYGSQVGFDCIVAETAEYNEECGANYQCADAEGRQLAMFCPAGHKATCGGCQKVLEDTKFTKRMEWMTNVVSGYARESLDVLGWEPSTQQIMDCACAGAVKRTDYGNNFGYNCRVRDVEAIVEGCGRNVLCVDKEGHNLLHFCPDGFDPSCSEGCTLPWLNQKEEL